MSRKLETIDFSPKVPILVQMLLSVIVSTGYADQSPTPVILLLLLPFLPGREARPPAEWARC